MALLHCCFGPFGDRTFDVIVCGGDVQRKKPNPEVYLLCIGQLGLEPSAALAFGDSGVGFKAALEAGIKTIVAPNSYTKSDDFTGADQVLPDLTHFHI